MKRSTCLATLATLLGLGVVIFSGSAPRSIGAQEQKPSAAPVPVEESMHEFMEYVFQPTYVRLKGSMAVEPTENPGWKAIKADSLSLAESGNLLLLRTPDKDGKAWNDSSVAVRDLGGQLYQAARKKDYASARRHYVAMIEKCNACHTQFADGEHQLKP